MLCDSVLEEHISWFSYNCEWKYFVMMRPLHRKFVSFSWCLIWFLEHYLGDYILHVQSHKRADIRIAEKTPSTTARLDCNRYSKPMYELKHAGSAVDGNIGTVDPTRLFLTQPRNQPCHLVRFSNPLTSRRTINNRLQGL